MSLRSLTSVFTLLCLFGAFALPAYAQQRKRVSPHETIGMVVDGSRVTITYGRPYSKDPKSGDAREIWGSLVPYGKVWRAGADEATLLITQKPLLMGGVTIPAGAYSLFFQPEANDSAKLVVNKQIGHWGTQYDATQDLARIDAMKEPLSLPVDQFLIALDKKDGGGVIKLSWAATQYSIPFTVQK